LLVQPFTINLRWRHFFDVLAKYCVPVIMA
jgi:hypothetical protein